MKNIQAQPIDMIDLIEYYDKYHPKFTIFVDSTESNKDRRMKKKARSTHGTLYEINVYDLMEFFIQDNTRIFENSHFVIDEVPIFQDKNRRNYILTLSIDCEIKII